MNVEVRNEAHLDIAEGVVFYDRQGYGAGDYFYQRIFEDIDSLSETGGIHERHFGYHRKIASHHTHSTGFPPARERLTCVVHGAGMAHASIEKTFVAATLSLATWLGRQWVVLFVD